MACFIFSKTHGNSWNQICILRSSVLCCREYGIMKYYVMMETNFNSYKKGLESDVIKYHGLLQWCPLLHFKDADLFIELMSSHQWKSIDHNRQRLKANTRSSIDKDLCHHMTSPSNKHLSTNFFRYFYIKPYYSYWNKTQELVAIKT